jgi:uncharacterized protein (DUF427 family)
MMENVWDYPRPPALERVSKPIRIVFSGQTIAETRYPSGVNRLAGLL